LLEGNKTRPEGQGCCEGIERPQEMADTANEAVKLPHALPKWQEICNSFILF